MWTHAQAPFAAIDRAAAGPLAGAARVLRSPGRALERPVREAMEARLQHSFADVRVHTDRAASRSAEALGARAYTSGRHIVFGGGAYRPGGVGGQHLLAHELTHVVQQRGAEARGEGGGLLQRQLTTPSAVAPPPPSPQPVPPASAFAPLTATQRASRQLHKMSRDAGPMVSEIEAQVYRPTTGAGACQPIPANLRSTVAPVLSSALRSDVPHLPPTDAPNPIPLATATAQEAMPIIHSHFAPHAPSRSPATLMAHVSRKPTTFGNAIRANPADLGEFLSWYAGENTAVSNATDRFCLQRSWWDGFASWLSGAGSAFNAAPHRITERAAAHDTWNTSTAVGSAGFLFGRAFGLHEIPHTVNHESMHVFTHPDFRAQVGRLQPIRSSTDIFSEGFTEYLARQVLGAVVTALRARHPPALTSAQATQARSARAYQRYVNRVVRIRDVLYRHGQDGEEAIRRAYFLGEGWRFALLETAGEGSPIETDRPLPNTVDVHFATRGTAVLDPAHLDAAVAYATTRSVARLTVVGKTDTHGNPADNLTLGQQRADAVRTLLIGRGVPAARITTSSVGQTDQIAGGAAANRRVSVQVVDPRNQYPGIHAPGRP